MESTTFAILASFSNLGGALSRSFGVFAMSAAGIKTDLTDGGSCYFDNLPVLIVVCGMILPLVAVPLTYVLIPDMDMHAESVEEESSPDATEGERTPLMRGESEGARGGLRNRA